MTRYDAIIVLGFDVTKDGFIPDEGKSRVDKAAELLRLGESDKVIFSGRVSYMHKYKPLKTEATAMKDYAISIGVPKSSIITEAKSKNTYQNAVYCKKIATKLSLRSVCIVTSDFQVSRAKELFNKVFGSQYKIDFEKCQNKLMPEELSIITRMEEIKTQRLSGKRFAHTSKLNQREMKSLLKNYLLLREAS